MHDDEPPGRAGERDVEVVLPTCALVRDAGRLDHDHRVELQALRRAAR